MTENFITALALVLKHSPTRISGDISELAWQWENLIQATPHDTSVQRHALILLHGLVYAYLRGLGYRMGNIQGFRKHSYKLALLCTEITKHVIEEGPIILPKLHAYGFTSPDKALDLMKEEISASKDILDVAEEILQQKQGDI